MLKNWPLKLIGLAIIVVLIAIAYKYWMIAQIKDQMDSARFGQFSGPADAPIVMVEFMDYRCNACRTIHGTIEELLDENDDLKVVYKHFPVFGPQAADEAALALGAGKMGKYKEMHDILINREQPVADDEIPVLARRLGFDVRTFMTEWRSPEIGTRLIRNLDDAEILGVNSTPTFYVNKKPVVTEGPQIPTKEQLQAAIDAARENL